MWPNKAETSLHMSDSRTTESILDQHTAASKQEEVESLFRPVSLISASDTADLVKIYPLRVVEFD